MDKALELDMKLDYIDIQEILLWVSFISSLSWYLLKTRGNVYG